MAAGNPSLTALNFGWITGVQNNGRTGFPRMEIDKFCQNNVRLNLFLLAMADIQKNDNFFNDKWCWFQIQAIHGVPDIPWDGVPPTAMYSWLNDNGLSNEAHDYTPSNLAAKGVSTPAELGNLNAPGVVAKLGTGPIVGNPNIGYCTHGSVLFPTWHRVYQAMLEQSVQARMVTIADQFPADSDIRRLSRTAAQQFRFPYWDPFQPRAGNTIANNLVAGLSMIFAVKQVQVRLPTSPTVLTPIPNPLYSYVFPGRAAIEKAVPSVAGQPTWASFSIDSANTYRHAEGSASNSTPGVKPGDSDNVDVERDFLATAQSESLQQKTYQSMTDTDGYLGFANNHWKRSFDLAKGNASQAVLDWRGNPNSLEGWHNTVHGIIGGDLGQMNSPTYAAFDPIFPFHHANVDFKLSLWQAINAPDWWKTGESAAQEDNYTTITGTVEDPTAPLLPFRKRIDFPFGASLLSSTFWRSDDVRDYSVLGYQYDVIPTSDPPAVRKQAATNEINTRYGWFGKPPLPAYAAALDPLPMGIPAIEAFVPPTIFYDSRTVAVPLYPPPAPTAVNHMAVKPKFKESLAMKHELSLTSKGDRETNETQQIPQLVSNEQQNGLGKGPSTIQNSYSYVFPTSEISPENRVRQWNFNFRALRHGLHTSFTVYVFLGNFPPETTHWRSSPNLILPLTQLIQHNPAAFERNGAGPGAPPTSKRTLVPKKASKDDTSGRHRCENCAVQEAAGSLIADWAPLTMALLRYLKDGKPVPPAATIDQGEPAGLALESLKPEHVVPFLQRNLHWRVLQSDGQHVPREEMPLFKAFVTEQMMKLPRHTGELPVYSKRRLHFDITHNRPGGLGRGEAP